MSESVAQRGFGGRWVVVTGASSGLGRSIAIELSAQGARLALIGRNLERLTETARLLDGADCRTLILDLARHEFIAEAVLRLAADVGPLYGLCHAAGVVATRPLSANTVESMQYQLDVNLLAGLEVARILCRRDVLCGDGGSLLFVSSVYARVGAPGQTGYSSSKGAIVAAVRAMAVELARRRVRVNCLSPGYVHTAMTERAATVLSSDQLERIKAAHPLGEGLPEDVAHAAAFMLSPAARWITGVDLAVDGGYTAQ